ncbi:MAG: Thiol-disulfide oxidoreductase ResA [Myxococcota bacterium]|nr:Thiol-disulfide oxidoreductase ResA [Myxococcota bacterium]
MSFRDWLAGVIVLALFMALAIHDGYYLAANWKNIRPVGRGDPAPEAALTPIGQAQPGSSLGHELGSRVTLIDFWATWCEPCRAAMPGIVRLDAEFRNRGLKVLSINVEPVEDQEQVLRFIRDFRMTMPVFRDDGGRLARAFSVTNYPTIIVLDSKGVVSEVLVGYTRESRLRDLVLEHLR